MAVLNQAVFDIVNKPGRIGVLATASKDGNPNAAYFGSPRLMKDGTLIMGLGDNLTLKNLTENPKAVFFTVAGSPVTFTTPGYRLYLDVQAVEKTGPMIDGIREKIAAHAGAAAAKIIVAAVVFRITGIRKLVAAG